MQKYYTAKGFTGFFFLTHRLNTNEKANSDCLPNSISKGENVSEMHIIFLVALLI